MDAMTTTPPDASTILAQWIAEENKVLQALLAGPGPGVARPDQIDGKTGLEQMQAMLQGELPYAAIAKTLRANINLIRYNEVAGMPFERPRDANVLEFQNVLRDAGINVHIRASRGRDIKAACGQLRHESAKAAAGAGGAGE